MHDEMSARLSQLEEIRARSGGKQTVGLADHLIRAFLETQPSLGRAIDEAHETISRLPSEESLLLRMDEPSLMSMLQERFMNFYPSDSVCPYVPVAARGPWIVTSHGAVVYDTGGYGMLGLGHAPEPLLSILGRPWPMTNVMTPTLSQKRFADALRARIGSDGVCPYDRFACLNSGSEAVELTLRLMDLHTQAQTAPGARHSGRPTRILALAEGFHGRTEGSAWLSHSTRAKYASALASFRQSGKIRFVPPNVVDALEDAFAAAERDGAYVEAMYIEPVMGEGAPGRAITRRFYDAARRLTREHGALLVVDSVQAALRAHGCLSVVDYPGFQGCDPPDMETFSKAINAGQFPLSVVALRDEAAKYYVRGTYGNTMTTNPRALELGRAVLDMVDEPMRRNIRVRGKELRDKLERARREVPGAILSVEGTGLLVCAELDPDRYPVMGPDGVEASMRRRGIQVIHGGRNGIRLTPHFALGSAEVDLIVDAVERTLYDLRPAPGIEVAPTSAVTFP